MDYRNRNYYLANIDYVSYDMRLKIFKLVTPSLKIHPPYNHVKNKHQHDYVDGLSWQMMLSCKKEDSEALEYELRKAERNDRYDGLYSSGSNFVKLSKELLGQ